jgi:hypothetical protein
MSFSKSKCLKRFIKNFGRENEKKVTIGRINRSNFGGFRVKPSPTKQGFVTSRFQAFSIHK